MKRTILTLAAVLAIALGGAHAASAQEAAVRKFDVSLLGGFQTINKNDTALPDYLFSIPAVAAVGYSLTPNLALEGDVTWMIPIERSVDVGSGPKQDRKTPNLLAYQAGVRAALPFPAGSPYLAAGLGAVTFLSSTDANRLPQLADSQTMFALNFGGGTHVALAPHWAVRADFRELAAFPSKDAAGLSSNGKADPIWMERAALGLTYQF